MNSKLGSCVRQRRRTRHSNRSCHNPSIHRMIFWANMNACDFLRAIFSTVTRIRTHNLSLTRTIPYHWATPSHMINNEIFFFYHHFEMPYITHFTAIMMLNENLFNYKVVDLVTPYNFHIHFSICDHLKILKIWNLKFKPCIWVPKNFNWKNFNYKVVDRVKTYNFCIHHFLI